MPTSSALRPAGVTRWALVVDHPYAGDIELRADGTLGSFEDGRLDKLVDILSPIFAKQNTPVKDGIAMDEIATNEFLDPSISLG